ncbi:MAG TPA: hypothetical protein VHA37_07005 [Candidatus Saccharimonadales bacterium]|nr:hypothetical protein [Candidatus Saccharimonadales bacterium]
MDMFEKIEGIVLYCVILFKIEPPVTNDWLTAFVVALLVVIAIEGVLVFAKLHLTALYLLLGLAVSVIWGWVGYGLAPSLINDPNAAIYGAAVLGGGSLLAKYASLRGAG